MKENSLWTMNDEDRRKYRKYFEELSPNNESLSGEKAKEFLLKSKLASQQLCKIWDLADYNKDGRLDQYEFMIACYLVKCILTFQLTLPSALPPSLHPLNLAKSDNSNQQPLYVQQQQQQQQQFNHHQQQQPPKLPQQEQQQQQSYDDSNAFRIEEKCVTKKSNNSSIDLTSRKGSCSATNEQTIGLATSSDCEEYLGRYMKLLNTKLLNGKIGGNICRQEMLRYNLPKELLAKIWMQCDTDQDGKLSAPEFVLALHLCNELSKNNFLRQQSLDNPSYLSQNVSSQFREQMLTLSINYATKIIQRNPPSKLVTQPSTTVQSTTLISTKKPSIDLLTDSTTSSTVSYEERRRKNFQAGEAELERRRMQRREQESLERRTKEEKERQREEDRRRQQEEHEKRRNLELDKELERQRQIEAEKEVERREAQRQARLEHEKRRLFEEERKRIQELEQQRNRLRESIDTLMSRNRSIQLEIDAIKEKMMNERDRLVEKKNQEQSLRETIDQFKQELLSAELQMSLMNEKYDKSKIQLESLGKMKNDLQQNFNNIKSSQSTDTIIKGEQAIQEIGRRLDEMKNELSRLENECEEKRQNVEHRKKEMITLESKYSSLRVELLQQYTSTKDKFNYISQLINDELEKENEKPLNELITDFDPFKVDNSPTTFPLKEVINLKEDPFLVSSSSSCEVKTEMKELISTSKIIQPVNELSIEDKTIYLAMFQFMGEADDELSIEIDDEFYVKETCENAWALAVNIITKKSGLVPLNFLQVKPSSIPISEMEGKEYEKGICIKNFLPQKNNHLKLNESDPIRIYGDNGIWYSGSVNDKVGWFPKECVEIVNSVESSMTNEEKESPDYPLYEARYQYNSGMVDDLEFQTGDIIVVMKQETEDGNNEWWEGYVQTNSKRIGIFPANHVAKLSQDTSANHSSGEVNVDKPIFDPFIMANDNLPSFDELALAIRQNEDSSTDALPFICGEVIRIISKDETTGIWNGSLLFDEKLKGYFASDYVHLLSEEDSKRIKENLKNDTKGKVYGLAMYEYQPQNDDELGIVTGDVIEIERNYSNASSWWNGRLIYSNGEKLSNIRNGVIPTNFIRLLSVLDDTKKFVSLNYAKKINTSSINHHRARCLNELIETERRYVGDLHMFFESIIARVIQSHLLPKTIELILANEWKRISFVNEQLVHSLLERSNNIPHLSQMICGDLMCEQLQIMRSSYARYCCHQNIMLRHFHNLSENSDEMKSIIKHVTDEKKISVDYRTYLMLPFQRLTKYPLMLHEIVKNTEVEHIDYESCKMGEELSRDLLKQLNETLKLNDNISKLEWCQQHILPTDDETCKNFVYFNCLTEAGEQRQLIHYDVVNMLKKGRCVLFLFNDIILITTIINCANDVQTSLFSDEHLISLRTKRAPIHLKNLHHMKKCEKMSFSFVQFSKTYLFQCSSIIGRDMWMKRLEEAQETFERNRSDQYGKLKYLNMTRKSIGMIKIDLPKIHHLNVQRTTDLMYEMCMDSIYLIVSLGTQSKKFITNNVQQMPNENMIRIEWNEQISLFYLSHLKQILNFAFFYVQGDKLIGRYEILIEDLLKRSERMTTRHDIVEGIKEKSLKDFINSYDSNIFEYENPLKMDLSHDNEFTFHAISFIRK
ncbi:hypothetical protein SNEBB_007027 [Seison nebaliae]|nr:hypothetical protein SNEBB_007027 [Seison nebaliae]